MEKIAAILMVAISGLLLFVTGNAIAQGADYDVVVKIETLHVKSDLDQWPDPDWLHEDPGSDVVVEIFLNDKMAVTPEHKNVSICNHSFHEGRIRVFRKCTSPLNLEIKIWDHDELLRHLNDDPMGSASRFLAINKGTEQYLEFHNENVDFKAVINVLQIESAKADGRPENTFKKGEEVYVIGYGPKPDTSYTVHLVLDTEWDMGPSPPDQSIEPDPSTDGALILILSKQTEKTDSNGQIPKTKLWESAQLGGYDIILDVDGDMVLDRTDALDNLDVKDAGFEVIPEFTTIAIPVAAILGLLFLFSRRRKKEE